MRLNAGFKNNYMAFEPSPYDDDLHPIYHSEEVNITDRWVTGCSIIKDSHVRLLLKIGNNILEISGDRTINPFDYKESDRSIYEHKKFIQDMNATNIENMFNILSLVINKGNHNILNISVIEQISESNIGIKTPILEITLKSEEHGHLLDYTWKIQADILSFTKQIGVENVEN